MFVVLGYPGAGKGTFAQTLVPYGYVHLSIGDMMRDELKKNSPIGLEYKEEIEHGKFLPSDIVHQIVESRVLEEIKKENNKIILDGYPRILDQAKLLELFLKSEEKNIDTTFIYIKVDPETASKRILNRRTCGACNQIYNLEFFAPQKEETCDRCNQLLIRRNSDNAEDVKRRIESFSPHLESLLSFYENHKKSSHFIIFDGNNPHSKCIQEYQGILK